MITIKVIFGGLGRRAVETAVAGLVLAVAVGVVVASAMVVRGANTALHRVEMQQRPDVVHLVGRYNRALWELPRSGLLPPSTLPVYVPLIDPAVLSRGATPATVLGRQSLLRNVVTKDGFTNTYLFGIQPSRELSVSAFRVRAGRFLHDDDQAVTVLDESSARSLSVTVGDSFPVRTAAGTDLPLRVVGIVARMTLRDPPPISVPAPVADPGSRFVSSGALVTLATSQQIFARDTLTDAMIVAPAPDAVPPLTDRLRQAFRTTPGVFIQENYTEFRRQVADYQSTLSLFTGLAVVVAVLGVLIVAALLQDIYRGRRDQYAILLALGYPPRAVIAHAVALATVIAAGAVVGTLAALLLTPRSFAMPALLAHLGPVQPRFDPVVGALAAGVTAAALAAGTAALVYALTRRPVAQMFGDMR
ncbi:MAG TPA: FtsX-like permease family protein [Pseudonocardiaceae bacterium]|nr:FtsX-like permease family protein [Pseudonocardiaceae bacterium]